MFGGTKGTAEREELDKHNISLISGTSTAMLEHQAKKRVNSLWSARDEVDKLNGKQ